MSNNPRFQENHVKWSETKKMWEVYDDTKTYAYFNSIRQAIAYWHWLETR